MASVTLQQGRTTLLVVAVLAIYFTALDLGGLRAVPTTDRERQSSAGEATRGRSVVPDEIATLIEADMARAFQPKAAASAAAPSATSVLVEPGDTLFALSRRHGVPVSKIIAANNLTGRSVQAGQRLLIPN